MADPSRRTHLRRAAAAVVTVCLVVLGVAAPAGATWSIVGVDPDTGEVGVAIASCVPAIALGDLDAPLEPVALVPGIGAGVSQAALNSAAPPAIQQFMLEGFGPDEVIDAITAPSFDASSQDRQHAVVLLDGAAAGFTGSANQATALHRTAENVSAQGNILVNEDVISDAVDSFRTTDGDLASRLVAALVAGAKAGGDSRCAEQTALFAHVVVAAADDEIGAPTTLLTVSVTEADGTNPVLLLQDAFDDGQRQFVDGPSFLETFGPFLAILGLVAFVIIGVFDGIRRRRHRTAPEPSA